jgi:hypothetical protein
LTKEFFAKIHFLLLENRVITQEEYEVISKKLARWITEKGSLPKILDESFGFQGFILPRYSLKSPGELQRILKHEMLHQALHNLKNTDKAFLIRTYLRFLLDEQNRESLKTVFLNTVYQMNLDHDLIRLDQNRAQVFQLDDDDLVQRSHAEILFWDELFVQLIYASAGERQVELFAFMQAVKTFSSTDEDFGRAMKLLSKLKDEVSDPLAEEKFNKIKTALNARRSEVRLELNELDEEGIVHTIELKKHRTRFINEVQQVWGRSWEELETDERQSLDYLIDRFTVYIRATPDVSNDQILFDFFDTHRNSFLTILDLFGPVKDPKQVTTNRRSRILNLIKALDLDVEPASSSGFDIHYYVDRVEQSQLGVGSNRTADRISFISHSGLERSITVNPYHYASPTAIKHAQLEQSALREMHDPALPYEKIRDFFPKPLGVSVRLDTESDESTLVSYKSYAPGRDIRFWTVGLVNQIFKSGAGREANPATHLLRQMFHQLGTQLGMIAHIRGMVAPTAFIPDAHLGNHIVDIYPDAENSSQLALGRMQHIDLEGGFSEPLGGTNPSFQIMAPVESLYRTLSEMNLDIQSRATFFKILATEYLNGFYQKYHENQVEYVPQVIDQAIEALNQTEFQEINNDHILSLHKTIEANLADKIVRSESRIDAVQTVPEILTRTLVDNTGLTRAEARQVVNYVTIKGVGGLKEEMVRIVADGMVASLMSDAVMAKNLTPYLVNQSGVVRIELSQEELSSLRSEARLKLFEALAETALGISVLNPALTFEVHGPKWYASEFVGVIGKVLKKMFETAGKKIRPNALQYSPRYPTASPDVVISDRINSNAKRGNFNPKSDIDRKAIEVSYKTIKAALLTGVLLLSKLPDEIPGVKKVNDQESRWVNEKSIGIYLTLEGFVQAAAAKAIERAA